MSVVALRFNVGGVAYIIPTFEKTAIQITRRVSTIDNLSSQGTTTKQTFRVPLSPELIEAIGDPTSFIQESIVDLNKKIEGSVLVDNFPRFVGEFQFMKAYKKLKADVGEAEFIFNGNETSLKGTLDDVKMKTLFDGETIPYTAAEINTYFTDPNAYHIANGYVFPLIDYGQQFTGDLNATIGKIINDPNAPLTQLDFKPAATFRKCFDLLPIVVTVDSAIDYLLDQAIPLHNSKLPIPSLDTSPLDQTGYLEKNLVFNLTVPMGLQKLPFELESSYNVDNIDLGNDWYTIPFDGTYMFTLNGGSLDFVNPSGTGGNLILAIDLYDYNSATFIDSIYYNNPFINAASSTNLVINATKSAALTVGQQIGLRVKVIETFSTGGNINFNSGFRWTVSEAPSVTPSSNIDVPTNCPDVTAWDIVRTIAIQGKAVIVKDEDGVYDLVPWVNWIDDNTDTLNLNDKPDFTKDLVIEPYSIQGAKSILLTYLKDEDLFNKAYTDLTNEIYGQLLIEDTGSDFATNEIKIEVPFASTPIVPVEFAAIAIPKFYDSSFNCVKTKPRVLGFSVDQYVDQQIYVQDVFGGTVHSIASVPQMGHWLNKDGGYNTKDTNFGQSLTFFAGENYPNDTSYEQWWKQYIVETYTSDARKVSIDLALSQYQVDSLAFNEKVYYADSRFRITAMNNIELTSQQFTSVEMMKRISINNLDIAPLYPYDIVDKVVLWKNSDDNSVNASPIAGELEPSCIAYGFYYDAGQNIGTQQGQILIN